MYRLDLIVLIKGASFWNAYFVKGVYKQYSVYLEREWATSPSSIFR